VGQLPVRRHQDAATRRVASATGPNVEWMTFSFPDVKMDSVQVSWLGEGARGLHDRADTTNQALAEIRKALAGEVKEWDVPYGAASFVFTTTSTTRPRR